MTVNSSIFGKKGYLLKSFFKNFKITIDCGEILSYNIVTVVESGLKWYKVVKKQTEIHKSTE